MHLGDRDVPNALVSSLKRRGNTMRRQLYSIHFKERRIVGIAWHVPFSVRELLKATQECFAHQFVSKLVFNQIFIDKYTQVPHMLNELVALVDQLDDSSSVFNVNPAVKR